MKLTALVLILLAVVSCTDNTGPHPTTAVRAWIPATCDPGTQNLGLRIYVDGSYRTTDTLSPGETGKILPVNPGLHFIQAQEDISNGAVYSSYINVPKDSTVSVPLVCN